VSRGIVIVRRTDNGMKRNAEVGLFRKSSRLNERCGWRVLMKLRLFPAERMDTDFPWMLWAIGWLAMLKALLWLSYEPVLPEEILRLLGFKYLLFAIPLIVCGVGLWSRRRWAVWGLLVLAAADLMFLLLVPQSIYAYLVDSEVQIFSVVLSGIMLICGGPAGDVLILLAAAGLFRETRRKDRG